MTTEAYLRRFYKPFNKNEKVSTYEHILFHIAETRIPIEMKHDVCYLLGTKTMPTSISVASLIFVLSILID